MTLIHSLCVEVTARCPLRCVHCSASATPERLERLDARRFERCVTELGSLTELYLSGGEPFEHPELEIFVRCARSVARTVVVYTSGVQMGFAGNEPLGVESLRAVAQAGASRLDVSLYAAQAADHDAVTQVPGSFGCALATLERLRTEGIPFGVHHVLFDGGSSVRHLVDLTEALGAARLHLLSLASQGRGRTLGPTVLPAGTLEDLRRLASESLPFELVLSSGLRSMIGLTAPTPRDALRSAMLDVHGFLYPGEGRRLPILRSRSSLHEQPMSKLLAELSLA